MNQYTVVMLGLRGSGKSAYLATLNHLLSRCQIADGLVVKVQPAADHAELENLYQDFIDPDSRWPPGTVTAREWKFTCEVLARGNSFPLLEIVYIDYRGELLEGKEAGDAAARLFNNIDRNAAMLALIDGEKILDVLEERLNGEQFYRENIDKLISWINQCHGPVHLVISKWDLLAPKYDLGEVTDLLFKVGGGQLKTTASQRAASTRTGFRRGFIRLIPVSALGGVAYRGPDGRMLKDPDALPAPVNVEVPMAAVLPDLILSVHEHLVRNLAAADPAPDRNGSAEPGTADWWANVFEHAQDSVTGRLMSVMILAALGAVGLVKVSGRLLGWVPALIARMPRPLHQVRTSRSALLYASRALAQRLRDFELDYRGSRLS